MKRHSQHALVCMLHDSGPMTVRQMTVAVYGSDARPLRKRMGGRILLAHKAGFVQFVGFADRPGQQHGLWPAKWAAKV